MSGSLSACTSCGFMHRRRSEPPHLVLGYEPTLGCASALLDCWMYLESGNFIMFRSIEQNCAGIIFTWFWNLEFQAWPGRGRLSLWRFHSKNCWFLPSQHRKVCSSFVLTWAHRWHAYAWPLAVCQWLVQQQLRRCCEVPWWQRCKIWRDLVTVANN